MSRAICLLLYIICTQISFAQTNPAITQKQWNAFWISPAGEPANSYGVYLFRKAFSLTTKPNSFIIHVSGDNRYKLFINEQLVSLGPARGDLFHWNYETIDIAAHLKEGANTATAIVWNEGADKPEAQISYRTAFILQGNTAKEEPINTNKTWKSIRDSSYHPLPVQLIYTYYVAGLGESIDMNQHPANWMSSAVNDTSWKNASELFHGLPKGVFDWTSGWMLVPSSIPQMELSKQRFVSVHKSNNVSIPPSFPQTKSSFTVPPHTKASLLLDQEQLTNAYPTLQFSKGKDAVIRLGYAEALYIDESSNKDWRAQNSKGNRNETEGKRFVGKEDKILSSGANQQTFTSLWWRTFRYLQLTIETKEEALIIDDLYSTFTGYPFQYNARITGLNDTLNQILETGWRTARLCAFETYMDCPFYEQLQYVGDTRIQALLSLYNSGDDRLMRNAIALMDRSRMAEGITLSRYPTANAQQIPPFSLWWINMLHDYWMYRPDTSFVKQYLPGVRQVLQFFSIYQQQDGSLYNLPYWNFTDWTENQGWYRGVAPIGKNGNSAALDLQLLNAYQLAAALENSLGMNAYAQAYAQKAIQLKQTIHRKYWDASKNLFADTPEKDLFSQHTNALAILTNTAKQNEAQLIAKKLYTDTTLAQATVYFKFYVHSALIKTGLGNDYANWLDVWKQNLQQGMTTWAEISDINKTRSDCHAWGAHPNIEFFRTVLGVDSDAPGFKRIKIEPHLGTLKNLSGEIPHPQGKVAVSYQYDQRWKIRIDLPKTTTGYFVWKGKQIMLKEGRNELSL